MCPSIYQRPGGRGDTRYRYPIRFEDEILHCDTGQARGVPGPPACMVYQRAVKCSLARRRRVFLLIGVRRGMGFPYLKPQNLYRLCHSPSSRYILWYSTHRSSRYAIWFPQTRYIVHLQGSDEHVKSGWLAAVAPAASSVRTQNARKMRMVAAGTTGGALGSLRRKVYLCVCMRDIRANKLCNLEKERRHAWLAVAVGLHRTSNACA